MNDWSSLKKGVSVHGRTMKYIEMGSGDPIVFQRGNPMLSDLRRYLMPRLRQHV